MQVHPALQALRMLLVLSFCGRCCLCMTMLMTVLTVTRDARGRWHTMARRLQLALRGAIPEAAVLVVVVVVPAVQVAARAVMAAHVSGTTTYAPALSMRLLTRLLPLYGQQLTTQLPAPVFT